VNAFKKGSRNYLFLPGFWYQKQIYAHWEGSAPQPLTIAAPKAEDRSFADPADTGGLAPDSVTVVHLMNGRTTVNALALYGGKIPCLFIQTENGTLRNLHRSKEARETGQLVMISANGDTLYNGDLREIKTRGHKTFSYHKKPYQIKLENKTDLLGTGKARTWILLADYLDISLLRNRITLDMARYAGMRYAVAAQSVDLFIDGQYMGVYLLTDKVQIGPNRIDIHDMEPEMEFRNPKALTEYEPFQETLADGSRIGGYLLDQVPGDITGGYLLEIDKAYRIETEAKSFIVTASGIGLFVDAPAVADKSQMRYLSNLINAFDRAIQQSDGIDPVTRRHYADMMDEESLALKFLLEEVSHNFDAADGSQYFYKDRSSVDPKLYAGPGWDYDLTYGNRVRTRPVGGYLTRSNAKYSWYSVAYKNHPIFRQKVEQLYLERYRPALEILCGKREAPATGGIRSLTSYKEEIGPSAKMNFIRWSISSIRVYNTLMGRSFNGATAALGKYLEQRIKGLDQVFGIK